LREFLPCSQRICSSIKRPLTIKSDNPAVRGLE
jgi:hypothetical protein